MAPSCYDRARRPAGSAKPRTPSTLCSTAKARPSSPAGSSSGRPMIFSWSRISSGGGISTAVRETPSSISAPTARSLKRSASTGRRAAPPKAGLCSSSRKCQALLGEADGGGFRTFRALGDIDDDALSLIGRGQPRPLQRGGVHEHVLAAAVAHYKAEALGRIVPLARAVLRRGRLERRPLARAETPGPRPRRRGGAAVDVEHLGHLRPALALRDAHFERLARLHLHDAEAAQNRGVQKCIARAVRQLDQAEALFGFEPLDDRLNRRSRGGFVKTRSAAEARRSAKIARRFIVVIVEGAPAPRAKITILFQDGFLMLATRLPSYWHIFASGAKAVRAKSRHA